MYTLTGPEVISGSAVPYVYLDKLADANYTLTYVSGGPAGAELSGIAPVSSQFLPAGATIVFTINFITSVPPPPCGNGIIDSGEDCDGSNLGGATCSSLGYSGGTLSCNASTCKFDASKCTLPPDYNLKVDPDRITAVVKQSSTVNSTQTNITINPLFGFSSDINLTSNASTVIPGAVGVFSDSTLSASEYSSGATFYVTLPAGAPSGSYNITITGDGVIPPRTVTLTLDVSIRDPEFKEVLRPIYEKLAKTKSYLTSNVFTSF